ncbi:transglutaminase-like domain-containing protein [Actinoplanes sp. NPDC023714]|uniref:transglutaminase-like domain-containing protein n=1 Tax=Actinoplanes sp. NPDC023714 TaxID=3154322 RepID=UPI00340CDE1E
MDYASPGPLSALPAGPHLDDLPAAPDALAGIVQHLVLHPLEAAPHHLPEERFATNQVRPAAALVTALLGLDPAPLAVPRPPERRIVGTCRHFTVLAVALLRHRGVPARARCGFATYFQEGHGLDHWVAEYRADGRWVRFDAQLGRFPEPGTFLSGGEAWSAYREGRIDAARFGVGGTGNWGPAEIRGNVIRDLAALNKVETLPWDEWGRMEASYRGETGDDYDALMDRIAAADDPAALYGVQDLAAPRALLD